VKFPVFSLLAGNFDPETGSLVTASSSGEWSELGVALIRVANSKDDAFVDGAFVLCF
jgi:hypothetical protein